MDHAVHHRDAKRLPRVTTKVLQTAGFPSVVVAASNVARGAAKRATRTERAGAAARERASRVRERAQRSEPRDRSAPTKRRARARVGESEGRSPSDQISARGR